MTEEEALVLHYLRGFAGQRMPYCKTLNLLADSMVGHVKHKFPVKKAVRRAAWLRLQEAVTSLRKTGAVIRHREYLGHHRFRQTIRINEAFVKNPFYRKHD